MQKVFCRGYSHYPLGHSGQSCAENLFLQAESSETSCDNAHSTGSAASTRGAFTAKRRCSVGPDCVRSGYSNAESPCEELEGPEEEVSWFLLRSEADVCLACCILDGEMGICYWQCSDPIQSWSLLDEYTKLYLCLH